MSKRAAPSGSGLAPAWPLHTSKQTDARPKDGKAARRCVATLSGWDGEARTKKMVAH